MLELGNELKGCEILPKFYDKLLQSKFLREDEKIALEKSMVIIGDEVANYFFNETPYWDINGSTLPNVAPPFPRFFVEYNHPKVMKAKDGQEYSWPHDNYPYTWGFLVEAGKAIDDCTVEEVIRSEPNSRFYTEFIDANYDSYDYAINDTVKWYVKATLYLEREKNAIEPAYWFYEYFVTPDGQISKLWDKGNYVVLSVAPEFLHLTDEEFVDYALLLEPFRNCLLLTLSFLHCKNVILKLVNPPA